MECVFWMESEDRSMDEVPPGFRFYPTEEELLTFYLPQKIDGERQDLDHVIPVLDVYDFNPWDLPQLAGESCRGDLEQWFFYIPRKRKEAQGGRPSRLTDLGYWKSTGSPAFVYSSVSNRVIGVKKTMVFYRGRAPSGKKTEWKMNEYKALEGEASSTSTIAAPKLREELTLCRVYKTSKTLRAFDRRPPSDVPIGGGTPYEAQAHIHGNETSASLSGCNEIFLNLEQLNWF